MSHFRQRILLAESCTQTVDLIYDLAEKVDHSLLQVVHFSESEELQRVVKQGDFSVALINPSFLPDSYPLAELTAQVHPKPVLALTDDVTADVILAALRDGASDVFPRLLTSSDHNAFVTSLKRFLVRAEKIEEADLYRDSLERSIAELREDQLAAQQIQQRMLPPADQCIGNWCFTYRLKPSLVLSGDFVDVVQVSDNLTLFYLADVSGHGASSALVTVLLKNMTNRLLRNYRRGSSYDLLSPEKVLQRLNKEVIDTGLGKHLTGFFGLLDHGTDRLRYAVGGHHPMPVLARGKHCSFLEGKGMPVGLFDEPLYDERELDLLPGDSVTLFSDGVLEVTVGETLQQKEETLLDMICDGCILPQDILKRLNPGDDAPDDIAVLTLSRV